MTMDANDVPGTRGATSAAVSGPDLSTMTALVAEHYWESTPLGPIHEWPPALKTTVQILLNSRYPMFVWWGPELINIYNDAYVPVLGAKHPRALGRPAREIWHEIWDVLGPEAELVMWQQKATWNDEMLLVMERHGYTEETYFTWSYSPVSHPDGSAAGVFCACTEETTKVIGRRRLKTLRELAAETTDLNSAEQAFRTAAEVMGRNPQDIPFALLYEFDASHERPILRGSVGVAESDVSSVHLWPLDAHSNEIRQIDRLEPHFDRVPAGYWPDPPTKALILPLARPGQSQPAGALIAGVSPYRQLDDDYRGFLNLVAGHIATAVSNARAYEAERRRAEALAELDKAKTLFFSNVSHEFRTPLTLMLGPLEHLLSDPHTGHREQIETVHRNGLRLLKLVNSLLDFSRIEAGRVHAVYEPTDVGELTTQLAAVFRSTVERAGLHYVVDCPPVPATVYLDREMWEKVVLNLISNAFKFTFHGQISVTTRLLEDRAVLSVQDTGTGIPEAELSAIFDRFRRIEGAQGRTYEGSGIGLALVRELVKLHGGSISVESELGRGTTFLVTIPTGAEHLPAERIRSARALPASSWRADAFVYEAMRWSGDPDGTLAITDAAELSVTETSEKHGTVLLADDNADMRDYVGRLLSSRFHVHAVADGQAALDYLANNSPDLVLTDVMMPRLDGFGLLRALRADPRLQTIPVIFLSARAGEESRVEGLDAGADDYLIKPFSARELIARVSAHIEIARARRAAATKERELREKAETAEAQLGSILESINDGFVALDADWRFQYVNPAAERMNSLPREAHLGHSIWELFPEAVGTKLQKELQRAMAERIPVEFEHHYEATGRWFVVKASPTKDGGVTSYFSDITEQKRMMERVDALNAALQERIGELETLLQVIPVGIAIAEDPFCQRVRLNSAFARMLQVPLETNASKTGPQADTLPYSIWKDGAPIPAEQLPLQVAAREGREVLNEELQILLGDGTRRSVAAFTCPLLTSTGQSRGAVGAFVDVTEYKATTARLGAQSDALERSNQELQQFAYTVSHDLHEPIRTITAFSQLLARRYEAAAGADTTQLTGMVLEATSRMSKLVSGLLDYARVAEVKELRTEIFSMETALFDAVQNLTAAIEASGAIVQHGALPTICADESQIVQLFQNLISNAIKYRKEASPVIQINAINSGDHWIFSVTDNGQGFEQEHAERIFGVFKRLHGPTYSGVGMGLAICRKIVERHGGRIWAESQPGEGSTFYFTIPATSGQQEITARSAQGPDSI